MSTAARGIRPDVVVIDPWVVLLHVGISIPHEAGRRHAVLVRLPATATGLDLIREICRVDPTGRAVTGDTEGAPGGQREIVRQAGMADRVGLGRQPIATCQPVDVRRRGVPDNAGRLLVLHHDDEDVAERWERRRWGRGWRGGGGWRGGRGWRWGRGWRGGRGWRVGGC